MIEIIEILHEHQPKFDLVRRLRHLGICHGHSKIVIVVVGDAIGPVLFKWHDIFSAQISKQSFGFNSLVLL